MDDDKGPISREKADLWETTQPLLVAMRGEFRELSKKKPADGVSEKKIAVVNRLLRRCREVLADEQSLEFLDLLDEEDVPQNSDVVLTLSQYVAAFNQFREAHHGYRSGHGDAWFLA